MFINLTLAFLVLITPLVPMQDEHLTVWRTGAGDEWINYNNYRIECFVEAPPFEVDLHVAIYTDTLGSEVTPIQPSNPPFTATQIIVDGGEFSMTLISEDHNCAVPVVLHVPQPLYIDSVCLWKRGELYFCRHSPLDYWTEWLTWLPQIVTRFVQCSVCKND